MGQHQGKGEGSSGGRGGGRGRSESSAATLSSTKNKSSKNKGSSGKGDEADGQDATTHQTSGGRRMTISGGFSLDEIHASTPQKTARADGKEVNTSSATLANISVIGYDAQGEAYSAVDPNAPKVKVKIRRESTQANPWVSMAPKSFRPKKKVFGDVDELLDEGAREKKWYCLDIDREAATALLDNEAQRLGNGAFVVSTSALHFATICMLYQGEIMNIPIQNDQRGLHVSLFNAEAGELAQSQPFPCLSDLVTHLSTASATTVLPCALNPRAMEESRHLTALTKAREAPEYDLAKYERVQRSVDYALASSTSTGINDTTYDVATGQSVDYDIPTHASSNDQSGVADYALGHSERPFQRGYDNMFEGEQQPEYNTVPRKESILAFVPKLNSYDDVTAGDETVLEHMEGYLDTPNTEDPLLVPDSSDGFIRISNQSFNKMDGTSGISFQPCKTDQWFFVGLSNMTTNYHGHKDLHFDDIDFGVFCMGSGKATARENEDEVGPYVVYEPGDTFEIKVVVTGYGVLGSTKRKKKLKKLGKKKLEAAERHVHYIHNGKVFYISTRQPAFPLWVDQAFHPDSLHTDVIKSATWIPNELQHL